MKDIVVNASTRTRSGLSKMIGFAKEIGPEDDELRCLYSLPIRTGPNPQIKCD